MNENDVKVIRGIRNAVAARGADWRYPNGKMDGKHIEGRWDDSGLLIDYDPEWTSDFGGCYNLMPNGEPACIIGFIAVDQGLPTMRASNALEDAEAWGVSDEVGEAMGAAQSAQDYGHTWGVAAQQFFDSLADAGYEIPEDA